MRTTEREARQRAGFAYQPALDGLRAVAVLAVIAYHDRSSSARGGYLGVDIFFVLSGYLITSLLLREEIRKGTIELVAFWVRRARRLLPALLVMLTVVGLWVGSLPRQQVSGLRGDGFASLFYVANWHFIFSGQSYFGLLLMPSPMRHVWSLAIEEQFYLLWPLVVLAVLRGRRPVRRLAVVCVAGTVASAAVMWILYSSVDPSAAYYGTDARAHQLLVGCLLAVVLLRWSPSSRTQRRALAIVGTVAALFVLVWLHNLTDTSPLYYHGGSLLFAIAVAAVIASAVQPARFPVRAVLSVAPLRWIGTISYGLYLWHWPIDVYLTPQRTGIDGLTLNLERLAFTFAFAIASFYLVERPIRRGVLGNLQGVAAPVAVVAVGVALVVATAGAVSLPTFGGGQKTGPIPCPRPDASQRALAGRTLTRLGGAPPPRAAGRRIVLIGDSWACSMLVGLQVVAGASGSEIVNGAVLACGVVAGRVGPVDGMPPDVWARMCPRLTREAEGRALRAPPDVVLWDSSWELSPLRIGDRTLRFGTPEHDRVLLTRMEDALTRVAPGSATLVIVAAIPRAQTPGWFEVDRSVLARDTENRRHLNALYHLFAAQHPGKVIVSNLSPKICPKGPPCAAAVGWIKPRPLDGSHFGTQGAVLAARSLVPSLLALAPTPAPTAAPAATAAPARP